MDTLTAERFMKTGIMALLVLMLAGCAHAAPITLTEQRITTDLADQLDPAISGNIIVYADYRSADGDIWYYDLDKNQEFKVTGAPGHQALADVSDGTIVYTDIDQGNIMLYDIATGTLQDITADIGSVAMDPSVGGGIVAWQDNRDGHAEIYGKNLGTGEVRPLSYTPPEDSNSRPASSGSTIVWQRCYATGTCDINAFDWSTGFKTRVTETTDADERNPDIFGTWIVYEALRDGEKDICLNSLVIGEDNSPGTGGETCLSLPGQQVNPSIWGDNVAFEDISAGGLYHVKLWNIPSGSVFDITMEPGSQYLNEIWENRIVYTDDREGQLDIYLTAFTFNSNAPPVADAGTSQSLTLGQTAILDGSGSSDPDGDPLTYHWSLTAVPAGSTAPIVDPAAPLTTFTPDLAGTYTVQLIVSDGLLESDPGTVQVQVVAGEETIIAGIRDLEKTITAFPPGVFKNANMQKTLVNKLDAVIREVSAGNYDDALDKLRHDILPKTDGCAVSGAPDKNDWITDCTAQDTLYPQVQSLIHALEAL